MKPPPSVTSTWAVHPRVALPRSRARAQGAALFLCLPVLGQFRSSGRLRMVT